VVHTSSLAAFAGSHGRGACAAAKAGVLGLSRVLAIEGVEYGVRSNVVSPVARTPLSASGSGSLARIRGDASDGFYVLNPANVSPVVGWLSAAGCPANGQLIHVVGRRLLDLRFTGPGEESISTRRWTLPDLDREMAGTMCRPPDKDALMRESREAD
jgi:NAD(P)-dependent dehydrogenase (short-subunit alcohol dehydrogenase family)